MRPHYGPGVDSAFNRNEYHECFLGGKGGRCVELTLIVLKSGSLNLLEPSGPVQACNGIALPSTTVMYLGKIRNAKRNVRLVGSEALATAEVYSDVGGFRKKVYWINQRGEK